MSIPLWLMIAGLASSVIFGGLQIWQNSAANGRNVDLQRENNDLQRQLAGQANDWNIQQWNRENAYNNPSAQMARLAGANLNPALIYGQGGLVNEAAASPAATMANTRAAQVQSPLANISNSLDPVSLSQVALNKAQADNLNAQTETENQLRQATYDNLVSQTNSNAANTQHTLESIKNLVENRKLTSEQIDQLKFDRVMAGKQYALDVKHLNNETMMTKSQIAKNKVEIEKILAEKNVTQRQYEEMIYTYAVRYAGLEASVGLTQAQIAAAVATARELGLKSDMLEGAASAEKYFAESLDGKHGIANNILANFRSGVQMVTRDFGNVLGILK